MNKKLTYMWIMFPFFICGCDLHYPTRFANSYFENVYFSHDTSYYDYNTNKYCAKYQDGTVCTIGKCDMVDYVFGGAFGQYFDNIYVFQDANRQCLLYSYSNDELLKLKKDAGFSKNSSRDVVLLGKTGISIISTSTYNKIASSFESHPYDPSLCKPKPSEIK
jgi:hypothetical protein